MTIDNMKIKMNRRSYMEQVQQIISILKYTILSHGAININHILFLKDYKNNEAG